MIAVGNRLGKLARDQEGATVIEFAFVLPPFLLLVLGGFDLAYLSYVKAIAQGALNDAARQATVQDPFFAAIGATLEERIENTISSQVDNIAIGGEYKIKQRSYFDFNDINNPERIVDDKNKNGQYDRNDNDCFLDFNRNGRFDVDGGLDEVGGANDVVFYTVEVEMPRLFPVHLLFGNHPNHKFSVRTAVRNQPYKTQATPPQRCGV